MKANGNPFFQPQSKYATIHILFKTDSSEISLYKLPKNIKITPHVPIRTMYLLGYVRAMFGASTTGLSTSDLSTSSTSYLLTSDLLTSVLSTSDLSPSNLATSNLSISDLSTSEDQSQSQSNLFFSHDPFPPFFVSPPRARRFRSAKKGARGGG